jgi:hypothetical protein
MNYLILLSTFFLSLAIHSETPQDKNFDQLWKEVSAFEKKSLPKSALEVVDKIYSKAKSEKRSDQLIKCILYKAKLLSLFDDKEPSSYIMDFEDELDSFDSDNARAIMHSILGELYHRYGIGNAGRFRNRSFDTNDSLLLRFESLEEIQLKSLWHYRKSVELASRTPLSEFSNLFNEYEMTDWAIEASDLFEFILFRAIKHYGQSNSFVSMPKDRFVLNDSILFTYGERFASYEFGQISELDFIGQCLSFYQILASDEATDMETRAYLFLHRIEYLRRKYESVNREEMYINALRGFIQSPFSTKAKAMAFVKMIEFYLDKGSSSNNRKYETDYFQEAFKWIQKYKMSYGSDGELNKIIDQQRQRLLSSHLDLSMASVIIPGKDFLGHCNYRNVSELHLRLYKINLGRWDRIQGIWRTEEKLSLLDGLDIYRAWSQPLPDAEDLNFHAAEIPFEAVETGFYILLASEDASFKVSGDNTLQLIPVNASALSYSFEDIGGQLSGRVINRFSGEVIVDCELAIYRNKYNPVTRSNEWRYLESVYSNNEGVFNYGKLQNNFSFRLIKNQDTLALSTQHYVRPERKERDQIHAQFYLDRSVYRPGQLVYFKALAYRKEADRSVAVLLQKRDIKVHVYDLNRQLVFEKSYTLNEYGTIAGQFVLPDKLLTGRFTIEAADKSIHASDSFLVEAYKRPGIKAEFDKITEAYVLGDTVEISGFVESYTGLNLENARVNYTISRLPRYPVFTDYAWRGYPLDTEEIIDYGSVNSDEAGLFKIKFATRSEQKNNWSVRYKLSCDITVGTGESINIDTQIVLSDAPYSLAINAEEFVFENAFRAPAVQGLNLAGEPQQLYLEVDVIKLKAPKKFKRSKYRDWIDKYVIPESEYSLRFPHDQYDVKNVDPHNWPVETTLASYSYEGDSLILSELTQLRKGSYKLKIRASNAAGQTQEKEILMHVSGRETRAVPVKALWVKPSANAAAPGEKVQIFVNSPYKAYKVFYGIYHNNQRIESHWIDESDPVIQLDIDSSHRGGLNIEMIMVKHNRVYTHKSFVDVAWDNKQLVLEIENMKDKTRPGVRETLTVHVKDDKNQAVDAELVAAMYDKSLDAINAHNWFKSYFHSNNSYHNLFIKGFELARTYPIRRNYGFSYTSDFSAFYPSLDWFGLSLYFYPGHIPRSGMNDQVVVKSFATPTSVEEQVMDDRSRALEANEMGEGASQDETTYKSKADIRENLNETVFFYPQMHTDETGQLTFEYTMNESLTEWRLMLFAHTKEAQFAYSESQVITTKPLMVEAFLPRFVRQGDRISLTARITNLSQQRQALSKELLINSALTGENLGFIIDSVKQDTIEVDAGKSIIAEWELMVPDTLIDPLELVFRASCDNYTDAEKHFLEIQPQREFVTETYAFYCTGSGNKEFLLDQIFNSRNSETAEPFQLKLEYVSDPRWIVLKSLPVMLEGEKHTTHNIIDAIYATILGQSLSSESTIRKAIQQMSVDESSSPLQENQDLKIEQINNTPWLRDAVQEGMRLEELSFLLDKNQINYRLDQLLNDLTKRQLSNGGLSWLPGGRDNWYATQYVLEAIARLQYMGVDGRRLFSASLIKNMIRYSDTRLVEHYQKYKDKNDISALIIQYLFVRSFYPDLPMGDKTVEAIAFYKDIARSIWMQKNSYLQSFLGIAFKNDNDDATAKAIFNSLNERMLRDEELGNYWNDQAGYYWYDANIEKQASIIAFFESMGAEKSDLDGMRLWLLKHKQTNSWANTKSTASAVYAFFNADQAALGSSPADFQLFVNGEQEEIAQNSDIAGEAFVKSWTSATEMEELKTIELVNSSEAQDFGALYWQYFEKMENLEARDAGNLKLDKRIRKIVNTDDGERLMALADSSVLQKGDRLRVSLRISVDRPMEFVLLRDHRASGTEPTEKQSKYLWQDGLVYYRANGDRVTDFFIEYLPKRDFVIEYELWISHAGEYNSSYAEIQSLYAPEFSSRSASFNLNIPK